MKRTIIFAVMTASLFFIGAGAPVKSQIAAGGAFTLRQSVAAGGGEKSAGGTFTVENTGGQSIAGQLAAADQFSLVAGFWTPEQLVPTAAHVSIGGRVTTADNAGIRNARVTLTNSMGEIRTTLTGTFGSYRFADVAVGEVYILSVSTKKYAFASAAQVVSVQEAQADLNFIADPL